MKLVDPHVRGPQPARNYAADEPMHTLQIAHYRRMSPGEKLQALARMHQSAVRLMAAGVRMRHPEWSNEQIERELRECMLYGVS